MTKKLLGLYDVKNCSVEEIWQDLQQKIGQYYTAESVTIGHPDRMCDQFSDAILNAYVAQDPHARVAVECMGGHGKLWVCGEVTSSAAVDIPSVINRTYREIGYSDDLEVHVHLAEQSPDIARGVDPGGAGDQGIVVGYACNETPEFLPLEAALAHRLTDALTEARRSGRLPYLKPDGKSQVTVNPKTGHIKAVVLSAQHSADVPLEQVRSDLRDLCDRVLLRVPLFKGDDRGLAFSDDTTFYFNSAGPFNQGGFQADTGLTGRKLVVDFYGPRVPIGGGCTHGKDLTKVDHSGALAAR
ncbi:MAG: methionine adenosyltransferase domain-containing protein, partial [bacterium]